CFFFFFSSRRRHTRWPRDWSSDVCSSDLHHRQNEHKFLFFFEFGYELRCPDLACRIVRHRLQLLVDVEISLVRRVAARVRGVARSEERRVGKECRCGWWWGCCIEKRVWSE